MNCRDSVTLMFKSLSSTISTVKLSLGFATASFEAVPFPGLFVEIEGSSASCSLEVVVPGLVCATDLRICRTFRGENLAIVSNEMMVQNNGNILVVLTVGINEPPVLLRQALLNSQMVSHGEDIQVSSVLPQHDDAKTRHRRVASVRFLQ